MPVIQTYPDYKARNQLTDPAGLIAAWFLDDPSGQSYSRVVNPSANASSYIVPRNIVINGTFDTNTIWTVGTGWSITGGQAVATASAAGQAMTQSIPMTIGKAYIITYTITVTAGSIKSQAGTANGATQTASGTYTDTLICTGNTTLSFTDVTIFSGTLDNVTVTQVNIPAYNSVPTQLLVDGNMETAGVGAWTVGNSATLSKQTGTPHSGTQVLRVARNGVSSPYAGQTIFTIGNVERAFGYVRSDGSATPTVSNGATILFTGTASTTWQSYDVIFVATATDLRLGTSTNTGTQYVEYDDCTAALDTAIRRDQVLQDNDMEASGTGYWVSVNSATLTKDTGSPHSGTQNLRVARNGVNNPSARQIILTTGKTYHVTGWLRSDGSATTELTCSGNLIVSISATASWTFIDSIFIAGGTDFNCTILTSTGTQYGEFDDLLVYEIPPLVGSTRNSANNGLVTLAATTGANGHLNTCYSFNGSNNVVNAYSTDLNSMFNPSEGTLTAWFSYTGSWTDGLGRYVVTIGNSGVNQIVLNKSSTNSTFAFDLRFGGVNKINNFNVGNPLSRWMFACLTWSKSNDQAISYMNGLHAGTTQTSLGTWNVNLPSTGVTIGSNASSGTNSWLGYINDVRLYNRALTPVEIYNLYKGAWPFYMNK